MHGVVYMGGIERPSSELTYSGRQHDATRQQLGKFMTMHIYKWIYIYIYPPAPFRGPPGCEGFLSNRWFQVPPVLQSPVDSQVFQSFPVQQSAVAGLPVWYLLLAVCRSATWCLRPVTLGPGTGVLPSPGLVLSTWVPPGRVPKFI